MSRTFVLAALAFACLGMAAGLNGPFVHDDYSNLASVLVPHPSWHQAFDAILSNGSGFLRRPLSNASFLLNFLLLGDSAIAFKAVNLALHFLNGVLFYLLGRQLLAHKMLAADKTSAASVALVAAMLWLAHPLNVSTVLYVVQRMTALSTCFVLLALWLLARHLNRDSSRLSDKLLVIGSFYGMTVLAVLSKESGALAPAYALAMMLLLGHGRLRAFARQHRLVITATVTMPLVLALIGLCLYWGMLVSSYEVRPFDMPQRLSSELVVLWKYLGHIFAPVPGWMHFFWDGEPIRNPTDAAVVVAATGWLVAIALALWVYRNTPWPLFALVWYLGGHAMESSIIPLDLGYEHRNYLPMAGVILATTVLVWRGLEKTRLPLRTLTLAVVAVLMIATGLRSLTWSSLSRLAAHEVAVVPESLRAQYNAYTMAVNRRAWDAAETHFQAMERLDPEPQWLQVNRLVSRCNGDPRSIDGAMVRDALFASAADERTQRGLQHLLDLQVDGRCAQPLPYDMRSLLVAMAQRTEARGENMMAADYYYMTGSLDWNRGDPNASARMLRRAVELAPNDSNPPERLVMVELARGNISGARGALEKARTRWLSREPWRLYRYDLWKASINEASVHP